MARAAISRQASDNPRDSICYPNPSLILSVTRHPIPVSIQYFALLRDQRGLDQESIETAAISPASLYNELATRHGFTLPQSALKVAVNEDFASWDQPLSPGDSIVFIPPVAGG